MKNRKTMAGKRLTVTVAVGTAAFAIATAVQASIPDSGGVIHGCYYSPPGKLHPATPRLGDLRVIDTDKGQRCASDEKPLDWSARAATGDTGATGASGPTGPTGPTGPALIFGNSGGTNLSANAFLGVGFQATTFDDAGQVVSAGTLHDLSVAVTAAPDPGSRTFTVYVNGVDTALACTIDPGSTRCTDSTDVVLIGTGDRIAVRNTVPSPPVTAAVGSWSVHLS